MSVCLLFYGKAGALGSVLEADVLESESATDTVTISMQAPVV